MQQAEARLTCPEFLESHTDYVDDALPEQVARRFDRHARECRACGRYDNVVRRGLLLARNLPEIQPSAHFHERLQARLMHLEAEPVHRPIMASSATVLVIAAVLAVIAITPLVRLLEQPAAPQPESASAAFPSPFSSIEEAPFAELPAGAASLLVQSLETSTFTPVVVSPPAVQTTSTAPRLISYPLSNTLSR